MFIDSSHSRIYLTSSNNPFEQIHHITNDPKVLAERQERNERLLRQRVTPAKRKSSPLLKVTPKSGFDTIQSATSVVFEEKPMHRMSAEDEEAIHRLPDSSDDENTPPVSTFGSASENGKSKKRKVLMQKRPLGNNRESNGESARRSKRQKTGDDQQVPSTMPEKLSAPIPFIDDFLSQATSSQEARSRKNIFTKTKKTYGGSQKFVEPLSSVSESQTERRTFKPVSPEVTPQKNRNAASRRAQFEHMSSSPAAHPSSQATKQLGTVDSSPVQGTPVRRAVFQEVPGLDSDTEDILNKVSKVSKSTMNGKSREKSQRGRRGSTSSLSSVDSLIEYQMETSEKAALMTDTESTAHLPPDHIRCPVCRRATSILGLSKYNSRTNLATLPLRKQTQFCHDHRIRDAKSAWKESQYPTIDWSTLPVSQTLRTHVEELIPVVRRKIPSYYLRKLDTAIANARSNQTEINRAFDIAQVHHGYYGPRGAKIITNAILENEQLQKVLNRQLRSDKTMRIANLGRLTDCVLLPEVLTRMVQEDMVLGKREEAGEQARKILEESVDVGLLLCADDDEVELSRDDDEP